MNLSSSSGEWGSWVTATHAFVGMTVGGLERYSTRLLMKEVLHQLVCMLLSYAQQHVNSITSALSLALACYHITHGSLLSRRHHGEWGWGWCIINAAWIKLALPEYNTTTCAAVKARILPDMWHEKQPHIMIIFCHVSFIQGSLALTSPQGNPFHNDMLMRSVCWVGWSSLRFEGLCYTPLLFFLLVGLAVDKRHLPVHRPVFLPWHCDGHCKWSVLPPHQERKKTDLQTNMISGEFFSRSIDCRIMCTITNLRLVDKHWKRVFSVSYYLSQDVSFICFIFSCVDTYKIMQCS